MARVKFDVSGVEGRGAILPAGIYDAKVTTADVTKPKGKDQRIELVLEIINNKDHNGKKLYEYVNLESEAAKWKFLELLEAVGVKDKSGTLDTDRMILGKKIGVKTFIRPADDVRGFDEKANVRRMFYLDGANDAAPVEDLSETVVADETEGEEITSEEVQAADRAGLKQINAEFELGIKVLRSMTDDDLRAAVLTALELTDTTVVEPETEEAEEEAEEEEPEAAEETAVDWSMLEAMDRGGLKLFNKENEVGVRVVKSMTDDDLREAIAEAMNIEVPTASPEEEEAEEAEEGEEAEASAQPQDDYDEWDEDNLREELGDRNLPTKGPKGILIKRLRKDDAEEGKPF